MTRAAEGFKAFAGCIDEWTPMATEAAGFRYQELIVCSRQVFTPRQSIVTKRCVNVDNLFQNPEPLRLIVCILILKNDACSWPTRLSSEYNSFKRKYNRRPQQSGMCLFPSGRICRHGAGAAIAVTPLMHRVMECRAAKLIVYVLLRVCVIVVADRGHRDRLAGMQRELNDVRRRRDAKKPHLQQAKKASSSI